MYNAPFCTCRDLDFFLNIFFTIQLLYITNLQYRATLNRATLDSQIITVTLQIVEELKEILKIKIYI